MLAFFGMPGPLELLIIGFIVLVPAAIVVAVIVAMSHSRNPPARNPNLEPCSDCGRQVSLRATTCPQCGRPLQTQQ